jgi:hypothetical protein
MLVRTKLLTGLVPVGVSRNSAASLPEIHFDARTARTFTSNEQ